MCRMAKKAHIRPAGSALGVQDAVILQERDYTYKYVECLKNHCNAVDGTFDDAINIFIA